MMNKLLLWKMTKFLEKIPTFVKTLLTLLTDELDIYNCGKDISYYSKLTSRMSLFNNHPSIQLIKYKYQQSFYFKFEFVSPNHVLKYVNEVDCNKRSGGNIPAKIIKMGKEELIVPVTNYK